MFFRVRTVLAALILLGLVSARSENARAEIRRGIWHQRSLKAQVSIVECAWS